MITSDGMMPAELEAAGEDGIFRSIQAKISGDKLIIETNGANYKVIRYGWRPFSRGNLMNEAGLPLSTFKYSLNNQE